MNSHVFEGIAHMRQQCRPGRFSPSPQNGLGTRLERGENRASTRSNGRTYRVGNVEDQRHCCVVSGLRELKQGYTTYHLEARIPVP